MKTLLQTDAFRRWEGKLRDNRARTLIAARLFRLANGIGGDIQPVGHGIYELRIHYGPGYRIYVKPTGSSIIILLCGGDKTTQRHDIAMAYHQARRRATEQEHNDDQTDPL
ncbi:type II toxin-antitoxin system RelE/ParE family toxin [Shimwellia blattae]|uniref:Addiction module killer protein n=1 Tax=Shimwellia blattae (strain ATCC 29907 / DSM 4481 / JCM 1650 / NBRC 105725 / CDC 9005-74) TaxID=630626 RepID=I2BDY5_SHIBC|nr:type II toxin-antitoxin system RelE/ParE family toxin [Shimwellia blattae]AFJ48739.1 hypothetical protein EBL_c36880 [Shimwellia blattae DSM 4481 = NBRC 105725]GAB83166.1 hypothetical protein EB105725_46_00070 [Shimwellia blattae DSM 4481 = NBRC 105725]VDY66225.1 putative addiction module killer protein [Shimwellia blattae]VEC27409.1 putative addiction module killer protein [Shimwellia blattae]